MLYKMYALRSAVSDSSDFGVSSTLRICCYNYSAQVGNDNEDTLHQNNITLPTKSTIVSLTEVTTPPQLLQVTIHGLLIQRKENRNY